jgi:hypothetical protein
VSYTGSNSHRLVPAHASLNGPTVAPVHHITSHRGSATAYTGIQLADHFCGIGWVLHVLLSGAGGGVVRVLKLQQLLSV